MRTINVGKFDAVITIFNAIGHLTKTGFEKAMRNIHRNLNNGGIYIFDIINLSYVNDGDNIIKMSYEAVENIGKTKIRNIQHSIINNEGILISYNTLYEQNGSGNLKTSKGVITLQLYTAKELKEMLIRNGFKVLSQCGIDGSKYLGKQTDRIVTVAQKQ